MKIEHTVHEIEAESFEEFMEQLGPILKEHMDGNNKDRRKSASVNFEHQLLELGANSGLDELDFVLSCIKVAASMSSTICKPGSEERFHELVTSGYKEYFTKAKEFIDARKKEREAQSMYFNARGRRDDTRSNRDQQAARAKERTGRD